MVSALNSGLSGPGSRQGTLLYCVLERTLHSQYFYPLGCVNGYQRI